MENKGFYINDLPQSGEVTFLAAVIEKELRPKRNGGSFLSVRLADRSGELDAKACGQPRNRCRIVRLQRRREGPRRDGAVQR